MKHNLDAFIVKSNYEESYAFRIVYNIVYFILENALQIGIKRNAKKRKRNNSSGYLNAV